MTFILWLDRAFSRLFGLVDGMACRPVGFFLFLALALAAQSYVLGPYSYLRWQDLGDSHISRYLILAKFFHEQGLTYWYPYAAGGVDQLSNGVRFFDAFFLLFYLFPGWLAFAIIRIVQFYVAGDYMRRILEEQAGVDRAGAMIGGACFVFLQPYLLEQFFGLGAVPLVIWAMARLHGQGLGRGALLAALAGLLFSAVSYTHLTTIFFFPCIMVWLWFVAGRGDWKMVVLLGCFGLSYVLAQADMIAAMALNSATSHRLHWDLSAPPWNHAVDSIETVTIQSLYFYAFSILAICLGARIRFPRMLLATTVGLFLIAWLQYEIRLVLPQSLGALKGFNMLRFLQFLPFLWAAAIGWAWGEGRRILANGEAATSGRRILVGGVAAATLCFAAWPMLVAQIEDMKGWLKEGSYTANFGNPQMEALAHQGREKMEPFRVATIEGNGLRTSYANAYGLESADSYLNMYPYAYKELWAEIIAAVLQRDTERAVYFHNYGPTLSLHTYSRRPEAKQVEKYFNLDLLSLLGVRYFISKDQLAGPGLEIVADTKPDVFWAELPLRERIWRRIKENFTGQRLLLYQNENALPRWFFAQTAELAQSDDEARKRLATMTARQLAATALVHAPIGSPLPPPSSLPTRIVPRHYGADRIFLEVELQNPALLVVTNSYNPFWTCRVDGRETPLLRVDLALWGVIVPKGAKKVEFTYRPPYRLSSPGES